MFVSIFKAKGHSISFETTSTPNGIDCKVFIDQVSLDDFLDANPIEKAAVLRQYIVHVTRIFNRRVQTFISKIVMSEYEGRLPVVFYTYRVEMQLRGMAHIHGCLWLCQEFMRKCGVLTEPELITELIDNFITCALPPDDDPLRSTVLEVQTHHHTKSCLKKSKSCRFGFPKSPSELTLIAQEPLSENVKSVAQNKQILMKAKALLNSSSPPTSFDELYRKLNVSREDYHSALCLSSKGKIVVLKRNFDELYINNYNTKWLTAWNANMDLQFCCDTYAIVTFATTIQRMKRASQMF